jgi:hypothetical protein
MTYNVFIQLAHLAGGALACPAIDYKCLFKRKSNKKKEIKNI